jgi:hypothetical protein
MLSRETARIIPMIDESRLGGMNGSCTRGVARVAAIKRTSHPFKPCIAPQTVASHRYAACAGEEL